MRSRKIDSAIRERLDADYVGTEPIRPADELNERYADAIRAVLDLHQPYWGIEHVGATCPVCADDHPDTASLPWPCPTVQGIASALGITQEAPNAA